MLHLVPALTIYWHWCWDADWIPCLPHNDVNNLEQVSVLSLKPHHELTSACQNLSVPALQWSEGQLSPVPCVQVILLQHISGLGYCLSVHPEDRNNALWTGTHRDSDSQLVPDRGMRYIILTLRQVDCCLYLWIEQVPLCEWHN
jgi:hypothetical protein